MINILTDGQEANFHHSVRSINLLVCTVEIRVILIVFSYNALNILGLIPKSHNFALFIDNNLLEYYCSNSREIWSVYSSLVSTFSLLIYFIKKV